jgi:hypothetical protein
MASMTREIKFSAIEERILRLIPKDGSQISSKDLVAKFYGEDVPFNAQKIIVGRLAGIARKAEAAALPWRLRRSGRAGPRAAHYWLVKA